MTLQNYNVTCSAVAVQIFSVHRSQFAPHLPIFGQSSCALYFFLVGHICLQCTAVISVIMQHLDRMCCMKLVLSFLTVVYICEFIDAREKNSNFFLKNLHKFAVTSGKFHDYRNHCTRWCVKHKDRNWVGMRKDSLLVGAQILLLPQMLPLLLLSFCMPTVIIALPVAITFAITVALPVAPQLLHV